MAAFDQVSKDADIARLRARRTQFLSAPNRVLSRRVIDFSRFTTARRYVRADAAGGGDGTTNVVGGSTGAWTIAERNSATVPAWTTVVYEPGDYAGTDLASDNVNVVDDTRGSNITSATAVGSGSWTATGVNGEYKYTGVTSTRRNVAVYEDGAHMTGLNLSYAQQNIRVISAIVGNTIKLRDAGYQLSPGDLIWMTAASLLGLTMGTTYYIVTAGAPTEVSTGVWEQDVTISASPTLTPVITPSALSGTPRFWTLYNTETSGRRYGIPYPGGLQPGEFAFVFEAGLPVVYMKPSSGAVADHAYHVQSLNGSAQPAALAARNTHILGGVLFGSTTDGVSITAQNCGVWGSEIASTNDGVIADGVSGATLAFAYVHGGVGHQSLSIDTGNSENGTRVYGIEFGDNQRGALHFGDSQHYILSPGSRGGYAYDIVSYRCGRVFDNTVPANAPTNLAILGYDSCSEQIIERAFIEAQPGAVVAAMPCQNGAGTGTRAGCNDNVLRDSVIDCRLNTIPEKMMLLRLVASGSGPHPNQGHIFEGNLFLLGDITQQTVTAPSAVSLRNSQTGTTNGTVNATLGLRNNVFYGGSGVGSAYVVTHVENGIGSATVSSSGNIFCGPSIEYGAKVYTAGSLTSSTSLANMTTYGTGPNLVKSAEEMSALYGADGRPLAPARRLGVFNGPRVDAEGRRRVETTPGPLEVVGLAA